MTTGKSKEVGFYNESRNHMELFLNRVQFSILNRVQLIQTIFLWSPVSPEAANFSDFVHYSHSSLNSRSRQMSNVHYTADMRSAIYHFIFYARKFWMHYMALWELKNQHSLLIFINRRMVGEASLQWATTVWHKSHATLRDPPRPSSPKRKKFQVQKVICCEHNLTLGRNWTLRLNHLGLI